MNQFSNILVYSMVNLGDVLLSTSAVALLKQQYPQAKITMMVRPAAKGLVLNNPVIDEVIVYDYKEKQKSWKSMLGMVAEIRQKKFDLCISFDRKLRPAILAWLAGIPVRVGPEKVFDDKPSWVTKLYTHIIPIRHDLVNTLQAETYQAIIRGFTKCSGTARPVMALTMPEHEQKAEQLLSTLPDRPLRISLCVKGTFALKNWPQERFAALIDQLSTIYNATFFIVGAPEDKEYADAVITSTKVPVFNFCGQTNLPELAALLKKSDLFISVDTGAAHIAATIEVPMVVIYGCTSPKRWHPLSKKAVALSTNEFCCPCSMSADGCGHKRCLMNISVEDVLGAVKKILL